MSPKQRQHVADGLITCPHRDFEVANTIQDLLSTKNDSIIIVSPPSSIHHKPIRTLAGIDAESWISRHMKTRTSYQRRFSYSEGRSIAALHNCIYDALEGFVIQLGDSPKVLHSSHHVGWQVYDFIVGRYGSMRSYVALVNSATSSITRDDSSLPTIIMNTKWSTSNYYHWIHEALPRLHYSYGLLRQTVRYLWIGDQMPLPYQRSSINKIGVVDYSHLKGGRFFHLSKLIWPSYHDPGSSTSYDFGWRSSSAEYFPFTPKKVFIARRLGAPRSFSNHDKILELALAYGYKQLYLEELTLDQQINIFCNATHVLAGHGAGLVNCLFGSHLNICEVMPAESLNPCFAAMATSIICDQSISSQYNIIFAPYAQEGRELMRPSISELACLLEN